MLGRFLRQNCWASAAASWTRTVSTKWIFSCIFNKSEASFSSEVSVQTWAVSVPHPARLEMFPPLHPGPLCSSYMVCSCQSGFYFKDLTGSWTPCRCSHLTHKSFMTAGAPWIANASTCWHISGGAGELAFCTELARTRLASMKALQLSTFGWLDAWQWRNESRHCF